MALLLAPARRRDPGAVPRGPRPHDRSPRARRERGDVPLITTRSATPADVHDLLALWARAAHGRSVSDDEASVAALVRHPTSRCVVAEHDGAIVGSVIVGWDGWRAHLYRLAVDPGHRRHGIASALVTEAERWASEHGAVRLDAMVDNGNDDGTGFWSAQGFRPNATYVRFERPVG